VLLLAASRRTLADPAIWRRQDTGLRNGVWTVAERLRLGRPALRARQHARAIRLRGLLAGLAGGPA
jgi:hypothetical protein